MVRRIEHSMVYAASWTATRPSRIAAVAVGYADGFLRSAGASKNGPTVQVIIAGQRCPLVGGLSMDLFAADVTDLSEGAARRACRAYQDVISVVL